VRDKQYVVCSDHADGLPARLALDLAVLRGDVVGIIEHMQCGIEADAVLPPVEPILPRIQVNSTATSRIYDVVYTLVVLGREREGESEKVVGLWIWYFPGSLLAAFGMVLPGVKRVLLNVCVVTE